MRRINSIVFFALMLVSGFTTLGQSGGIFTITETVTASGGGASAGGVFSADFTTGQPTAGGVMQANPFAITPGFWNFTPLEPTAAYVSVGGRIMTVDTQGIGSAQITLQAADGAMQSAISNAFGYYRFENVMVGETYLATVSSKRFSFVQPMMVVTVVDEITDLDFVGSPREE